MARQTQQKKQSTEKKTEEVKETPKADESREAHLKDIDDLLDEIDGVLETNAEEFVKNYVQKGGE